MKQFLITLTIVSLYVLASSVAAQDSVDPSPKIVMEKRQEVRENIKAKRMEVRDEIKKKREELRLTIKEKREEFKKKIQTLKDERKKQIVERLDEKMSMINTNMTDRMLAHLEKMEDILSRLQEKVDTAKNEGKDTTAAQNAITNAQSLIDTAKAAVTEQAGKDYTPAIPDETTLRAVVGTSMSGLRADLSALHKQVVDAKQAVMKAVMEVAKLRGQTKEPTTVKTVEPTITP
ncbi:hypothetical protein HYW54_01435 [Candidatus Gottesmanbacteria bacterium]|nr:hypothetical protein [Candidatus Gottesmanbacteria bacterium]